MSTSRVGVATDTGATRVTVILVPRWQPRPRASGALSSPTCSAAYRMPPRNQPFLHSCSCGFVSLFKNILFCPCSWSSEASGGNATFAWTLTSSLGVPYRVVPADLPVRPVEGQTRCTPGGPSVPRRRGRPGPQDPCILCGREARPVSASGNRRFHKECLHVKNLSVIVNVVTVNY